MERVEEGARERCRDCRVEVYESSSSESGGEGICTGGAEGNRTDLGSFCRDAGSVAGRDGRGGAGDDAGVENAELRVGRDGAGFEEAGGGGPGGGE